MSSDTKNGYDLILKNAQVIAHDDKGRPLPAAQLDVGILQGKITGIGSLNPALGKRVVDISGLTVLPGVIDSQVHFREPGLVYKEDFASGTRGALMGGVTSVFEMPNTKPPTLNALELADKCARAEGRAWVNMGFYMGSSSDNFEKLPDLEKLPGCIGIKVFFGSSTGNMLFNDLEKLKIAMKSTTSLMSFHCEDEDRLKERMHVQKEMAGQVLGHMHWRDEDSAFLATKKVIGLAESASRKVHILHITTAKELEFLAQKKSVCTVEVLPQHLSLHAPECYEKLGTKAQMNPPIRGKEHQDALWKAIQNRVVDVIGSDHAPHTLEEKDKAWPLSPSGMPGVQTLVPVMLDHVNAGRLSLGHLTELISTKPAQLAGLKHKGQIRIGFDADLTIVDLKKTMVVENSWIQSKCGWSPFEGKSLTGWPVITIINGQISMRDAEILTTPLGKILKARSAQ